MTQTIITITLRGEAADKLREAQNKPRRIDWTGFSKTLEEKRANG